MSSTERLVRIGARRLPASAGSKAKGLRWLAANHFPVPVTWVVLAQDSPTDAASLRLALDPVVRGGVSYAVRSSADVEDGSERSFAGQFDSLLDVAGVDAVVDAVVAVRNAATSERVSAYRDELTDAPVRMGVLVQEMVAAQISGVAFSVNPTTGLAETIIEAVPGSGDALVQHGVTPERWVFAWGKWKSIPTVPVLSEATAHAIARDVADMARRRGTPVDVEWVWDGATVTYVQIRPVTTIGDVSYYSNRFSREVLPGIILPLVWSVNIPLVNGAWIRLLERLVGPTGLRPSDLAARFYARAYFNMGALGTVFDAIGMPRESLEILSGIEGADGSMPRPRITLGTLRHLPRVLRFAADAMGHERRANATLTGLQKQFAALRESLSPTHASVEQVVHALDELRTIVAQTADLNVLTPLLSEAHNHVLARRLKRHSIAYDAVDFANRDPGDEGRDPTAALARLHRELAALGPEAVADFAKRGTEALRGHAESARFIAAIDAFTELYGHFSDSGNDFSHVPWREDPAAVAGLIAAVGQGRSSATRIGREQLPGGRKTKRLFDRAARYQVLRERISSFYTLCYGFHRPLYLRLSVLASEQDSGWPPRADAIFYLEDAEVRALARNTLTVSEAVALVADRAAETEAARDAVAPDIVFGDEPAPLQEVDAERLSGVATSSGRHTGRVVRVESASSAKPVLEGDVLVVPYSDVAWTPLFSSAGAIVAESGGFLSHTSIVAREYGIPAVVSVTGALRALKDGDLVTVDGYSGTITMLNSETEPDSEVRTP